MPGNFLQENEIVVAGNAVKYHAIEYAQNFVIITQNRIRRRIYKGWYFDDTGTHIYVSVYYSHIFQHKSKTRQFIVNTATKEWRDYQAIVIEHHKPERIEPKPTQPYADLIK
jgi:hypothetical protein